MCSLERGSRLQDTSASGAQADHACMAIAKEGTAMGTDLPSHASATPAATPVSAFASTRRRVLAVRVAVLALAAVGAILAARLVQWGCTQPVSFDGAMNLEVARSLAEGNGYRRMYDTRPAFSPAIQTRAPYILPAAGAFAAFGVGIWQAQLTNLLYLLAFALVAFALLRRWASWRWGLLAAVVCLATPGIEDVGLNGYGEVPALTWWLFALLVLYRPGASGPTGFGRCLAAGVLIGMAVVTKTVLSIGLVATLPVLFAHELQWRPRLRAVTVVAGVLAGTALPLLLHEIWRSLSLAEGVQWLTWLDEEVQRVRMQAGVSTGFADTPELASKILAHLGVLAGNVGLPVPLLVGWLAAPLLLALAMWRSLARSPVRPVVLTLLAFAGIYFAWWLGVTPTQKAWYRRIFDGVLVLELLGVFIVHTVWREGREAPARTRRLIASGVCALAAVAAWLTLSVMAPQGWPTDERPRALAANLRAIGELPADAALYGTGWYSHPTIALYAGRHVRDINKSTPATLPAQAFLLVNRVMQGAGRGGYWLQRYPHRVVADTDNLSIIALTTDRVADPFAGVVDADRALGYVQFATTDYPYAFGFHRREGEGWRWARADVEVLLRYDGESDFAIDAFMPEARSYRWPHGLAIQVSLDDCDLGTVRPPEGQRGRSRLPVRQCALQAGQLVHARLRSDNVIRTRDDRQLSVVVRGLGFEYPAALPPDDVSKN